MSTNEQFILYYGREAIGTIGYNRTKNQYSATLNPEYTGDYPYSLFGIFERNNNPPEKWVRNYIETHVFPKDREGIDDILRQLNLTSYDPWNIYVAMKGRNADDQCHI